MPQMAPIMWILIAAAVFFIFMVIVNSIYFFNPKKLSLLNPQGVTNLKGKKIWKW